MITVLLALATFAADPTTRPDPAPTATPVAPLGVPAAPAARVERRYCISQTLTGSRMPKKICRTREEWQRVEVDLPG